MDIEYRDINKYKVNAEVYFMEKGVGDFTYPFCFSMSLENGKEFMPLHGNSPDNFLVCHAVVGDKNNRRTERMMWGIINV